MKTIHITRASEGQRMLVGADVVTIKAGSAETAESMLIFETRVLAGGTLVQQGSYDQLLGVEGTFRELVRRQQLAAL